MKTLKVFSCIMGLILLSAALAGCGSSVPVSAPVVPAGASGPTLDAPELNLYLDNAALTSDGLKLQMRASVFNPNSSDVNLEPLKIAFKDETGKVYAENDVPAGLIPALASKPFSFNVSVSEEVVSHDILLAEITSSAAAGKEKILLNTSIPLNMRDIKVSTLKPRLVFNASFPRFTSDGSNLLLETKISGSLENPNPLRLDFSTIRIIIKDRAGTVIATSSITGDSVPPASSYPFSTGMILPLRIMNEKGFTANLEALCGIDRFDKTVTLTSTLVGPELKSLVLLAPLTLKAEPLWQTGSPWPTPSVMISTGVKNTNWFAITAGNTKVNVFDSSGALIKSGTIGEIVIPGSNERELSTSAAWGSSKFVPKRQEIIVKVDTEIGVSGISQKIPVNASTTAQVLPPL